MILGMMIGRRRIRILSQILSKEEEDAKKQMKTSPTFSTRFRTMRKVVCRFQLLELKGWKGKWTKTFPRRFIRSLLNDNALAFLRNIA
jgi:hypothetical protein